MKHIYLLCAFSFAFNNLLPAQMPINGQTRYGNEWIRYGQPYYKIAVAQDGVYRISYQKLAAAGFPVTSVAAAQVQLWHFGEQVPIYTSTEGILSNTDFIEFYAKKNRGELDRFLYKNAQADPLNPDFSMFTDTAAYYLTYTTEANAPLRYQNSTTELTNLPAKEIWCWHDTLYLYNNRFYGINRTGVLLSSFDNGEGYGGEFAANTAFRIVPNYPHQLPDAAPSRVQVRANTINPSILHRVFFNIGTQVAIADSTFGGQLLVYNPTLPRLSPTDTIQLRNTSGRTGIASVRVTYPQSFNFNNENRYTFILNGNNTEKYLEIDNFQHNNTPPILYDFTTNQRITTGLDGNMVKVKLESFTGERTFYLFNPVNSLVPESNFQLNKVELPPFTNTDKNASFIIITSRKLRQQGNAIQNYATYRASAAGGSHQVVVLDVEDLYEQFAYGIQRHPLALRNFGHFIKQNWTNPKFVLLIGKAREFNASRNYNAAADALLFVPTFGLPGSDNLLLASNDSQVPVIPIGRIAATRQADVEIYLEKLKEYENPTDRSAENRRWRKEVVHLGGGKTSGEQQQIESAMNSMRNILTNNLYGANINTYYKQSTDVTQRVDADNINQLVQQDGAGIITFFGHGGAQIIDLSIGEPATFTNTGRYPIMFALGCYSGNIHFPGISYSENFVFQPRRAGIAFVGTSDLGYSSELGPLQQSVYQAWGGAQYGKSLGEVIQAALRANDRSGSALRNSLLQQYTLHGDPALVLQPHPAPDYVVDRQSIQFNPAAVSVQEDSFDLNFKILNVGKNVPDSLTIKISRELPNRIQKNKVVKIKAPAYLSEPLQYRFPVADSSGNTAGFNRFLIELDPDKRLAELPDPEAERNNSLTDTFGNPGVRLFIFDKGVIPVQPLNYAIVNTAPVRLQASTATVFETPQRYRLAIDTSKFFNSLLRKDTLLTSSGGVIDWQPGVRFSDSTVYYWRIALDSLVEGTYNWTTQSFTYLPNHPLGWRQGHFQQWQENNFTTLSVPDSVRQFRFDTNPSDVLLVNYAGLPPYTHTTAVNRISNIYLGGIDGGGVIVYVFDGASGDPWGNPFPGRFGSVITEGWAAGYASFPFSTRTADWRSRLIRFLNDTIPDGHYVLLHTVQHFDRDYAPKTWLTDRPLSLFDVLEKQGATKISQLRDTAAIARPYVLFYRKGGQTPIYEILADSLRDTISQNFNIPGFGKQGSMASQKIGPARKWTRLQQQVGTDPSDQFSVGVYGIRADDSRELLLQNFNATDTTLEWINAAQFPSLELTFNAQDSVRRSPAQLRYWQVLYEGVPEAALNPALVFEMSKDTLQEGDSLQVEIAINNLSQYDMDSLLVHYSVISESNQVRLDSTRLKPLLKQDTLIARLKIPTKGRSGKQQLLIEINPTETQPDQPELYHFNNIGALNFFVQGDRRNPLVDVTFDGIRILNGDLVSAKPQIVIALRDENPNLPLLDTATMEVFLQYPNQFSRDSARRIPSDQMRFEPGKPDAKGSKATLYFNPEFTEDGEYTLLVNGRDASANKAGTIQYQVQFEVITENKISNVFNYPNPFTTSTQFVYTLTGAEPPQDYTIQVMTVSGRIVRELTELDLGPLRIGTHRTELAWDGTDQYGDRLANGVYLYRVLVKDQTGKNYEKHDTSTDRFFKNNIGKLVILR
jgi:hypothetical protein